MAPWLFAMLVQRSISEARDMLGITWVEIAMLAIFGSSVIFSIGFCVHNYGRAEKTAISEESGA
jgi:hypothetical protein